MLKKSLDKLLLRRRDGLSGILREEGFEIRRFVKLREFFMKGFIIKGG